MGQGEVLDFNFYNSNPTGTVGTPTAFGSNMFLRFDGIGNTEDLVVILKLVGAGADGILGTLDDTYTTKAIVIDNSDILKHGDVLPAGYNTITPLDNNDGLVIIESNDYNGVGEHWVIAGAQVITSTEGITGSGINLNGATGSGGASTTTENFGAITTDNDILKISDIGIVTATTTTADANLTFTVSNVDADGDTTTPTALNVTVEGSNTFIGSANADAIEGTSGNDTLTGNGGNDLFVLLASGGGHDTITDFATGADQILVDVASQSLTIGTSTVLAGTNFHTGDETVSGTWTGGTGNEFVYNATTHELWFSANGTGSDKVDLAHITNPVAATDIHTF